MNISATLYIEEANSYYTYRHFQAYSLYNYNSSVIQRNALDLPTLPGLLQESETDMKTIGPSQKLTQEKLQN